MLSGVLLAGHFRLGASVSGKPPVSKTGTAGSIPAAPASFFAGQASPKETAHESSYTESVDLPNYK